MRRHSVRIGILAIIAMLLSLGVSVAPPSSADTQCDSTCIYNQLVNHQIPVQAGDGIPQYSPWGSYLMYTGANGLEIRLAHDTTWNVLKVVGGLTVGTVGLTVAGPTTLADLVISQVIPKPVQAAASVALGTVLSAPLDAIAQAAIQQDYCLGITIPGNSVSSALADAAIVAAGTLTGLAGNYGVKLWFEPCSLNRGSGGLADTASPASLGVLGLTPQQAVNALTIPVGTAATNVQMLIAPDSSVYAKNTIGYAGWQQETTPGNATQIASGGGVQMFLRGDSAVFAKDSLGQGNWVQETDPGTASAIAVSSTGVQMIIAAGASVWAKNTIGYGSWTQEVGAGNASKIAVGGNTQMFLRGDNAVFAKNTIGNGGWTQETGPGSASAIAVSSTGVQMLIASDASIYAKSGIGNGGWTQEVGAGNAAAIAVGGDTQMFIRGDSAVFAKTGIGNGGWTQETSPGNATAISVSSAGVQMFLRGDNAVFASSGIGSSWVQETDASSANHVTANG